MPATLAISPSLYLTKEGIEFIPYKVKVKELPRDVLEIIFRMIPQHKRTAFLKHYRVYCKGSKVISTKEAAYKLGLLGCPVDIYQQVCIRYRLKYFHYYVSPTAAELFNRRIARTKRLRKTLAFWEQIAEVVRVCRFVSSILSISLKKVWKELWVLLSTVGLVNLISSLKEQGAKARRDFFAGKYSFRFLKFTFHNKDNSQLQFSYIQRALPRGPDADLSEYIERISTPTYIGYKKDFKEWLKEYIDFYKGEDVPSIGFSPSNRACLEFTRREGGQMNSYGYLVAVGYSMALHDRKSPIIQWMTKIPEFKPLLELNVIQTNKELIGTTFEKGWELWNIRSNAAITTGAYVTAPAVTRLEAMLLYVGCWYMLQHVPAALTPLSVREKGFKSRIPTKSWSFLNLIAGLLRDFANLVIKNDPRIKDSLSSKMYKLPKGGVLRRDEKLRSQDLTTATDNHDPELTAYFYKELLFHYRDILPFGLIDLVDKVCCDYLIVEDFEFSTPIVEQEDPLWNPLVLKFAHLLDLEDQIFQKIKSNLWVSKPYLHLGIRDIRSQVLNQFKLDRFVVGRTRRGTPMGVSTSWPLLPIYSIYWFEKTSTRSKITIFRSNKARIVPENWHLIRTVGDDMVSKMTEEHSRQYNVLATQAGARISKTKDYFSEDFCILAEAIYDSEWKQVPVGPFSTLIAIKAVHAPTFINQYSSLRMMDSRFLTNFSCKLKYSPFYKEWKHLNYWGVKVYYPESLGGLGLPGNLSKRDKQIFAFINRMDYESKFSLSFWERNSGPALQCQLSKKQLFQVLLTRDLITPEPTGLTLNSYWQSISRLFSLQRFWRSGYVERKELSLINYARRWKKFFKELNRRVPVDYPYEDISVNLDIYLKEEETRLFYDPDDVISFDSIIKGETVRQLRLPGEWEVKETKKKGPGHVLFIKRYPERTTSYIMLPTGSVPIYNHRLEPEVDDISTLRQRKNLS